MAKVRTMPCAEGERLGIQLVRMFGQSPDCCNTCAFRLGSFPNRCVMTVADALKCVVENVDFMCHEGLEHGQEPWKLCAGWIHARNNIGKNLPPKTLPFPFSDEIPEMMMEEAT